MPLSNAEKQRRHRERLQRGGLVHVQGWVTPDKAMLINRIISGEIHHSFEELISIKEQWEQLIKGRDKQPRWEKCAILLKQLSQALDKNIL